MELELLCLPTCYGNEMNEDDDIELTAAALSSIAGGTAGDQFLS